MRYHVSNFDHEALIESISAHIASLPDEPAPVTIEGDIERGTRLYEQAVLDVVAYINTLPMSE